MERKTLTCNSFVFYGSFYEAISVLPLENQAKIYDAIFKFAFENIEVDLQGVELAVFLLVKPQLLANRAKYENGCKGGRPRKEETETKPNENLTETEVKPNVNDNVNDNYISLLNILKEKMNKAGAYNGVHDSLVNEVLETLSEACFSVRPRRYNGVMYRSSDFAEIANNLTIEQICRVVTRLLQNASTIENRRQYILSVLCGSSADEKSLQKNANLPITAENKLFAKYRLYAEKVIKTPLNRGLYKCAAKFCKINLRFDCDCAF